MDYNFFDFEAYVPHKLVQYNISIFSLQYIHFKYISISLKYPPYKLVEILFLKYNSWTHDMPKLCGGGGI